MDDIPQSSKWNSKEVEVFTLRDTNMAPEDIWLEDEFPFGARPIFRCKLLVSGRLYTIYQRNITSAYRLVHQDFSAHGSDINPNYPH